MKFHDVEIGKEYKVCNGSRKLKGCYCVVRGLSKTVENAYVVTMTSGELIHHSFPMLTKNFKEI